MSIRREHRRFQPFVAELPLRISPAVFGASTPGSCEVTTAPDMPGEHVTPPILRTYDGLYTTAPDSSC